MIGNSNCDQTPLFKVHNIRDINILTYWTIFGRDLASLAITVTFLIRVGRRENSLKEQLVKGEGILDAMDLYTVLDSVTPLMAFSKYLEEKKPNHQHLLRFIKMVEIFEEQLKEVNEIKNKLAELEVEFMKPEDKTTQEIDKLMEEQEELRENMRILEKDIEDVRKEICSHFMKH